MVGNTSDDDDDETLEAVQLEVEHPSMSFQVIKVPGSLASQWRSSEPGSIVGVALSTGPNSTQKCRKRDFNQLVVSETSGVKKLQLHPDSSGYSHTHLFQERKRQRVETYEHHELRDESHIGTVKSDSGVRVVGTLTASRTLSPSLDAYRRTLKARSEAVAKPASRTVMAPADARFKHQLDFDGGLHLFKFYSPNGPTEAPTVDNIKQRPTVASREQKLSNNQLRQLVFMLFESKGEEGVLLKEFQAKIKAPQAQLRSALEEIGDYTARAGHRPRWFLKKEYSLKS